MGFMTEMSFLNDDWHNIKGAILEDPQGFVDEVTELMNGRATYGEVDGERKYTGSLDQDRIWMPRRGMLYLTVHCSHHADDARLYLAYRNSFKRLDRHAIQAEFPNPNDALLDSLINQVGHARDVLHDTNDYLTIERQRRSVAEMEES